MRLLASVTEQSYSTPELAGLPEGWWPLLGLLLLLGLGYAVFWLYRREARVGAPLRLRVWLSCVRCIVLALLAIVWLEPVIANYTIRTITANVVLLTDVSASMAIVDPGMRAASESPSGPAASEATPTRIERVVRLLTEDDHAWLRRLADRNELLVYTFGERAMRRPLPWDDRDSAAGSPARASLPERADPRGAASSATSLWLPAAHDKHTDLGRALQTVFTDVGESPVAGVIVVSDGNLNHGMSAEDAAAYARRFKAPIYTVGVGSPQEPPNLRITSFTAPPTTARGDPFEVRVEVSAMGIEPTSRQLELTMLPADADPREQRVVATREITIGGDRPDGEVRVELSADVPGEFIYGARLAVVPGEAVESDNQRQVPVLVLDERLRVLLIAGRPSYDYRYVTRLLERDRTIDLSCWLQSADVRAVRDGDTVITELPRRPEDIFAYDVLLLLDPNPREFDSAWAITVRRLVDEFAGGVFLQAGPHFTSRFLRDARLEDLITILPIVPDADADVRLSEQGAFRTRAEPIRIPDDARAHPLLQLDANDRADPAIWEALPGVWWYLPVLREKPLANALMRHGSTAHATRHGQPVLMATQPFGSGRTAFLAFENTWRWRGTGEPFFDRFWIQLVRYLGQPRREGVSKRGTIVLDRETISFGDYLKIEARVLDPKFVPWHRPEVEGHVVLPAGDQRDLTLEAIPGRTGWFAGRLQVDWTGPAIIRIPLPGNTEESLQATLEPALIKHIIVRDPDVELRALRLAAEPLMNLATRTGGEYLTLGDAARLADLIENASQVKTTRGTDKPLWDKSWLLAAITVLLGTEWTLRRRNHLL